MSDWTAERTQQLRDDWSAGVSSGVIANKFGTSRSAVCSKVRQLGLPMRARAHPIVRKSYDNSRRAALAQAKAPSARSKPAKPVQPRLVPLLDLKPGECRWPFGDRDFVFCALPADGAFPYCACHARMAYQKVAA